MTDARDFILSTPTRFQIYDGSEYYPVTLDGLIGRQGWSEQQMSGDWRVLGMSFHPRSNSYTPWAQVRARLAAGQSLDGYLWDSDHGTTRRWGRRVKIFTVSDPQESQAQIVVAKLLEDDPPPPPQGSHGIRDFILATGGKPDDPAALALFKRQAVGYIKWANRRDPEAGYFGWQGDDDVLAALRAIKKAKTLDDAITAFAPYESEPSFLYMVTQGYF